MHAALFAYNVLSYASTVKHTDKKTKETTELGKGVATNENVPLSSSSAHSFALDHMTKFAKRR